MLSGSVPAKVISSSIILTDGQKTKRLDAKRIFIKELCHHIMINPELQSSTICRKKMSRYKDLSESEKDPLKWCTWYVEAKHFLH